MTSFGRNLLHPVPIVTFAASALTYFFTGLWWLLPLGVLASCIVAAISTDTTETVADELAGCTPEQRMKLKPLMEEKTRILEELKRNDVNPFLDYADIASRVNDVVESYRHLLEKLGELRPLLDERESVSLTRSIADLERQMNASSDAIAKDTLTQAMMHRKDEQGRLLELGRCRERVEAQLLSLASALTNLRVRLIQNRVSEETAPEAAAAIRESLNGLFHEVEVAEKTSLELSRFVVEDDGRMRRRAAAATQAQ
jgi:hypothetical protein